MWVLGLFDEGFRTRNLSLGSAVVCLCVIFRVDFDGVNNSVRMEVRMQEAQYIFRRRVRRTHPPPRGGAYKSACFFFALNLMVVSILPGDSGFMRPRAMILVISVATSCLYSLDGH